MYIPRHLQIETINGICSSRCIMCTFQTWSRKKNIMSNDTFKQILTKFLTYRDNIEYLTLHGCGEPLLDKGLPEKIKISKDLGFKGTGFASNCTHLSKDISQKILEAGLDTIIVSIDGINKETHESIRIGTNYDQILENIKNFIELRNKIGKTRIIVRFIRQKKNASEFDTFKSYWKERLDSKRGDDILVFDIHNWGEKLNNFSELHFNKYAIKNSLKCVDVYKRMLIYSNGNVGLCCADDNGFFNLGNVLEDDPINIYNNQVFSHFREMMDQGRIFELNECKKCTVPLARYMKNNMNNNIPLNITINNLTMKYLPTNIK